MVALKKAGVQFVEKNEIKIDELVKTLIENKS